MENPSFGFLLVLARSLYCAYMYVHVSASISNLGLGDSSTHSRNLVKKNKPVNFGASSL